MDTKMDYKKMNTKELLSLISEQVINEEINENHKLIIQDVLKELFVKKCEKYKFVHYVVVKIPNNYHCEHCCEDFEQKCNCDGQGEFMSYHRKRVIKYITDNDVDIGTCRCPQETFPHMLYEQNVKEYNRFGTCSIDEFKKTYIITKIEDIEC
tara:strand:+ start:437 stop:895 length:459 start_codon:yes stop_codon:yes gene_type:complete